VKEVVGLVVVVTERVGAVMEMVGAETGAGATVKEVVGLVVVAMEVGTEEVGTEEVETGTRKAVCSRGTT
jgi:hypothetical protein